MAFDLEPITESFYDEAPVRYVIDVQVPADPDYVWSEFTRQNTLDWCKALKKVTYTSPAPYDDATTRTAVLLGGVTLHEQFFLWDEDRQTHHYRHGFYGLDASVPGLKHFGEYTEVTPGAGGGSRIVWKFALQLKAPALPAPIASKIAGAAFGLIKRDTVKHFSA